MATISQQQREEATRSLQMEGFAAPSYGKILNKIHENDLTKRNLDNAQKMSADNPQPLFKTAPQIPGGAPIAQAMGSDRSISDLTNMGNTFKSQTGLTQFESHLQKSLQQKNGMVPKLPYGNDIDKAGQSVARRLTMFPETLSQTPGFQSLTLDQARRFGNTENSSLQGFLRSLGGLSDEVKKYKEDGVILKHKEENKRIAISY